MQLWQTNPLQDITLARGDGCTVWDISGKPYLDLLSGTWCSILGHSHPRWLEAVRSQASVLTRVGAAFPTVEVSVLRHVQSH
jgi:acetylornithine/succinyldiaminopimelate/putrescine aminotransferase